MIESKAVFRCIERWLHISSKHGYDALQGGHDQFCINKIIISQYPWSLIKTLGDRHYFVQYSEEEGSIWELTPMTLEEVYALQRPRSIQTEEKFQSWCEENLFRYSHLKLHTAGKNTL